MRFKFEASRLGLCAALFTLGACSPPNLQPSPAEAPASEEVAEVEGPAALRSVGVGRKLMIIGNIDGELVGSDSRDAILTDRLLADVGGAPRLRVLVVPAASASPAFLGSYLRSVLAFRGVAAAQVDTAHIANSS